MPTNKMLIDASHPEETRVVVLKDDRIEEFDFESAARKLLKGSIYLAKVTRVEPSLQAAFVDFGGNRHGFLAFNEVHPDYYQIPYADRQALLQAEAEAAEAEDLDEPEGDGEETEQRRASNGRRRSRRGRNRRDRPGSGTRAASDERNGDDSDDDSDGEIVEINGESSGDEEIIKHASPHSDHHDADDEAGSDGELDPEDAAIDVSALLPEESPDTAGLEDDDEAPSHRAESRLDVAADETIRSEIVDDRGPSGSEDAQSAATIAATDDERDADRDPVELAHEDDDGEDVPPRTRSNRDDDDDDDETAGDADSGVESLGRDDDVMEEVRARPRRRLRSYKIQEVIKRRQIVLVQVVKEERGTKGAALTTYLSLAGRYTVLMPNTARGGGISRKITNAQDRKRLKAIAQELDVPEGMGLIIRTAGAARTKQEIKRDFEYLLRLWESVRDLTLKSVAPALVYEEGNLIKRAIRDLYSKDIEEILVAGGEAHREAKDFMRMLMPSHAKFVVKYEEPDSLFAKYGIENKLSALFSPIVTLPSGGYLVINQTEALVAIDINSGRATREFSIEETALKTNLEASSEIARQLKLRDLAGLIVVDFIDMDEKRNNRAVERRLKECLKGDRARIQVGRISHFGLLEMSRQRLRTGVVEGSTTQCPHCQGSGIIRSVESISLAVIRGIEDAAGEHGGNLVVRAAPSVAFYILNHKRHFIAELEARNGISIEVLGSDKEQGASFSIDRPASAPRPQPRRQQQQPVRAAVSMDQGFDMDIAEDEEVPEEVSAVEEVQVEEEGDARGSRRRRRRRGRRGDRPEGVASAQDTSEDGEDAAAAVDDDEDGDEEPSSEAAASADQPRRDRRSRRRGRRGGQRGRDRDAAGGEYDVSAPDAPQPDVLGLGSSPYVAQAATVAAAAAAARRRHPDDNRRDRGPRVGEGSERPVEAAAETAPEHVMEPAQLPATEPETAAVTAAATAPATAPAPQHDAPRSAPSNGHAETASVETNGSGHGSGHGSSMAAESHSADEPVAEAVAEARDDAGEGSPAMQRRGHWGEPRSSTPTLKHMVVGATGSSEDGETGSSDGKPQRRGWWQRNFG